MAILLAGGFVLAASQTMHASVMSLVGAVLADVGGLVPPRIAGGLGAILQTLGAGWLQRILGPVLSGGSGSDLPALGGVLAAPVYTVVRRSLRTAAPEKGERKGAPPHRIRVAAAKVLEPELRISTVVQESI